MYPQVVLWTNQFSLILVEADRHDAILQPIKRKAEKKKSESNHLMCIILVGQKYAFGARSHNR